MRGLMFLRHRLKLSEFGPRIGGAVVVVHGGKTVDYGLAELVTTAQFMQALRDRKLATGLTFRELSVRARENGDYLPHSTLVSALGRQTVPRAELLAAFIRACGAGEAETNAWLAARARIGQGPTEPASPKLHAELSQPAVTRSRSRLQMVAGVLVLAWLTIGGGSAPTPATAERPSLQEAAQQKALLETMIKKAENTDASIGLGSGHCVSNNPWGKLCIRVSRSGPSVFQIEGSIENSVSHCSMALMVSGTSPNGKWYGSAKRTPCGVPSEDAYVHTYVWKHDVGLILKPDTRLCVQAGIYIGESSPNPTDWNRNKACVWISHQPPVSGKTV